MSYRELKDIPQIERELEYLFEKKIRAENDLQEMQRRGFFSSQFEADARDSIDQQIRDFRSRCRTQLENLAAFPYWQIRHAKLLQDFWRTGAYEESVFIMTKFQDKQQSKDKNDQLDRVLGAISSAVESCSCKPRIAQFPNNYHPGLWDNVELHLLGCERGIAVVEDRYNPELNPNVMMEWGWMRGMGKRVFFLREKNFRHFRADLGDLLSEEFDWDNPEPGVSTAVKGFLKGPR
jgi:hypothetical protein